MSESYDLAKAGFDAAFAPVAGLIEKIAGPVAEEIGLTLRDHVKVFRLKRQLRLLKRTKEMLAGSQTEPQRVPLKLLVPIIEHASLEEDDDLQDRWAALLANNANGRYVEVVFPEILRQLSSGDAYLLRMCFHEVLYQTDSDSIQHGGAPPWSLPINGSIAKWDAAVKEQAFYQQKQLPRTPPFTLSNLSRENLTRLGLIERNDIRINSLLDERLSELGCEFAMACEDPETLQRAMMILATGRKPQFSDFP